MPAGQGGERADHRGLVLVGLEVRDGHERRDRACASASACRHVGARVDHLERRAAAPVSSSIPRARDLAVGDHGAAARSTRDDHRAAALAARRRVGEVAAVHRDDERHVVPAADPAQRGVARGHRVVGVDEVAAAAASSSARRTGPRRPAAPARVAQRARRRDEPHVADRDAVELASALRVDEPARPVAPAGRGPAARARRARDGSGRSSASTRTSTPWRAHGERLAVRPDPPRRVGRPRVVLRDDRDAHRV